MSDNTGMRELKAARECLEEHLSEIKAQTGDTACYRAIALLTRHAADVAIERWDRAAEMDNYVCYYLERRTGDKARAACGVIDAMPEDLRSARLREIELVGTIQQLRREIRTQQIAAERRNQQLRALHVVWCTGCRAGNAHEIDEALVQTAEREVRRLREYWTNNASRLRALHSQRLSGADARATLGPPAPGDEHLFEEFKELEPEDTQP